MKIADIEVPEVKFTDLLSCITRNGRQALVRKMVAPFAKLDNIAALASEGVSTVLDAGANKLTDKRCRQIAVGCDAIKECCTLLGSSLSPDGDGGKAVTDVEKMNIKCSLEEGLQYLVTQATVTDAVEKLIQKVP